MSDCGHQLAGTVREAGHELISLGCAVLPLRPGGKKPHLMLDGLAPPGQGGVHLARRDHAWWDWCMSRDCQAGAGVACGAPSSLAAADLDVKSGDDGPGNFAAFLCQYGLSWPAGPAACSPSGGTHLWARWPASWGACPERPGILPGVDVKGDGGYIVVPPSQVLAGGSRARPGEPASDPVPVPYRWLSGCPCTVPEAPSWLPLWLATAPRRGGGGGGRHGEHADLPPLEQVLRDGFPRGMRDDGTYRMSCSLFAVRGTGPGELGSVHADMLAAWHATPDKGDFGPGQVRKCVESAHRFMSAQEAAALELCRSWMAGGTGPAPRARDAAELAKMGAWLGAA